jgi:predicted DNA-binding transcriptional regulator YafY
MSGRAAQMLARVWRTVEVLQRRRAGITVTALAGEAGISRSTAYRYLALLERAGVPLVVEGVNGEARYSLAGGGALPALGPRSAGRVALGLARELLAPIEGTDAVKELDDLLARFRAAPASPSTSVASRKATHDPAVARIVDRALAGRRQLSITYRGAVRRVEPAGLRVAGAHAYLVAGAAR